MSHNGLQIRSTVKAEGLLELSLASVEAPDPGADEVVVQIEDPIAPDVLRHRLLLTYEAEAEGVRQDALIADLLASALHRGRAERECRDRFALEYPGVTRLHEKSAICLFQRGQGIVVEMTVRIAEKENGSWIEFVGIQ